MKLKTLKDLKKDYEWKFDTYSALRAEAIKWIKELSEIDDQKGIYNRFNGSNIEEYEANILIKWIKHFFNISEADLK